MQKKHIILLIAILVVVSGASAAFGYMQFRNFSSSQAAQALNPVFSKEELADIIKPSVVRIIQHVKGKAFISAFQVDFKDLSVSLIPNEQPVELSIDEYFMGSGFIINPDGYILTNAHVVSDESVKLEKAGTIAYLEIMRSAGELSDEEIQKISGDEQAGTDFGKRILKFVSDNSRFDLEKTITVLNPSSTAEKFQDMLDEGYQATAESVNDNFFYDDKDVGLIKIDQKNLPAMKLADSLSVTTGKQIYIFGFPATAEFNYQNLNESTFTQGVIGSIKDSQNKDFKIFQTDAKISQGSSGGPLFDERGQVIGIVTYETNEFDRQSGDNFAFAIPITLAKEVLQENKVANSVGDYGLHLAKALGFLHTNHCAQAQSEFQLASNSNKDFVAHKFLEPYIEKCAILLAAGTSVDTSWDEFNLWLKGVNKLTWFMIVAGVVLAVIAIFVILWLLKRLKKDEKELTVLEHELDEEKTHEQAQIVKPARSFANQPEIHRNFTAASQQKEVVNPQLIQYVKDARHAKMDDTAILAELKKNGWPEAEITAALN